MPSGPRIIGQDQLAKRNEAVWISRLEPDRLIITSICRGTRGESATDGAGQHGQFLGCRRLE